MKNKDTGLDKQQRSEIATRLLNLRKAAGLTQTRLAKELGIPQRTLAFYELNAQHIPSSILPRLSNIFNVSIEEILGIEGDNSKKRGPKSQVERQIEKISQLPKNQQEKIISVVEAFVNQYSS